VAHRELRLSLPRSLQREGEEGQRSRAWVRGVGRVEWCEGGEWGGVGAFIARKGDGSASGRWQCPTSERGQTSAWGHEHDVGGLASSRSEAEAERAGEGSLGFSLGGSAPDRC
jgi:hypothetical protein